jgi:hypothetical protein
MSRKVATVGGRSSDEVKQFIVLLAFKLVVWDRAEEGGILTILARYMTGEDFKAFGIYRENGVLKGPEWLKNIEQGAATTIWCAVSPQLNNKGGVYCEDCDIAPSSLGS